MSDIDVMTVLALNQLLEEHHMDYTLHTVGGCACCGLEIKCHGDKEDITTLLSMINEYLSTKWLVARINPYDPSMLYIDSKFDKQ